MNHTLRAKQQKANLDKLDKILASLPEAQYDHSEEEAPAKKQKNKKSEFCIFIANGSVPSRNTAVMRFLRK